MKSKYSEKLQSMRVRSAPLCKFSICLFVEYILGNYLILLTTKKDLVSVCVCKQDLNLIAMCHIGGNMAQGVRAVVWQSEGCRFDLTLAMSKCP